MAGRKKINNPSGCSCRAPGECHVFLARVAYFSATKKEELCWWAHRRTEKAQGQQQWQKEKAGKRGVSGDPEQLRRPREQEREQE